MLFDNVSYYSTKITPFFETSKFIFIKFQKIIIIFLDFIAHIPHLINGQCVLLTDD